MLYNDITQWKGRLPNTLKVFGPYWAKGKLVQLYFYKKGERVQLSFLHNVISNGLNQGIRNNMLFVLQKKNGKFGHKIEKTIFKAQNITTFPSTSGNVIKEILKNWFNPLSGTLRDK